MPCLTSSSVVLLENVTQPIWTVEPGMGGPEPVCQGHSLSRVTIVYVVPIPFDITAGFCVNTEHERANHSNFHSEVEELTFMINIIPN